jgi:hypothetical protein
VVDEAVYALSEMQPGLEKVYFTLEQELLKPRYQIKYGGPDVAEVIRQEQAVAKMLFANVQVPFRKWTVNTVAATYQECARRAAKLIDRLGAYIVLNLKEGRHGEYLQNFELRPDLVEYAGSKKALVGLQTADPWGEPFTLAQLQKFDPLFQAEPICLAHSENVAKLYELLCEYLVDHTLVGGSPLPKELPDVWGRPLTIERLSKYFPMFKPEAIAALTDDVRKTKIYQELLAGRRPTIENPATGLPYDIEALAKENPVFSEAHLKTVRDMEKIQKKFREIVQSPMNSIDLDLKFKPVVAADPIVQSHPQYFNPRTLAEHALQLRFQKVYQAVKQWIVDHKQEPADDVIDQLLKAGKLTEADLVDVFGRRMQWIVNRNTPINRNGCGCEMTHFHLFSTGPDGKQVIESQYHYGGISEPQPPQGYVSRIHADSLRQFGSMEVTFRSVDGDRILNKDFSWAYSLDSDDRGQIRRRGYLSGEVELAELRKYIQDERALNGLVVSNEKLREQLSRDGKEIYDLIGAGGGGGGRYGGRFGGKKLQAGAGKPDFTNHNRTIEPGPEPDYMEIGRVREWFPETLFWRPQVITDEHGRAELAIPLADSITTWRVTAMANSLAGQVTSAPFAIRVFQDFFVDIDFPVFLTQNDLVKVPISINNYLKERQHLKLQLVREDWFELLDEDTRELEVEPNQVTVAHFKVRARTPGRHKLLVKAYGTKMSDAVRRDVEVVPDGKRFETVINETLAAARTHRFDIPDAAVDGGTRLYFKLYPSTFAQVLDGLDGMLKMPYG